MNMADSKEEPVKKSWADEADEQIDFSKKV